MASLKRYVHPQSKPVWKPLAEVAADISFTVPQTAAENGASAHVPMALAFVDPDQEMHDYIFDDDGRKALIQQLLGTGLVLPK